MIIDPSTGRAIGVEYVHDSSEIVKRMFAKKEVIVSAGVVDSPKLLMLSGIGPKDELEKAGIDVLIDLPVGRNLQDHLFMPTYSFALPNEISRLNNVSNLYDDLSNWKKSHKGPLSSMGMKDLAVFDQSRFENVTGRPDLQFSFKNIILQDLTSNSKGPRFYPQSYYSGITVTVSLMKANSRGFIKLNDTNPQGDPLIFANYLTDKSDLETLLDGCRKVKAISETESFRKFGLRLLRKPKKLCEDVEMESVEYFRCVAVHYAMSSGHPVGTCKMGPRSDPQTVVDSKLKVHGIKGLRVVDASIMPVNTRGNTNAPTLMIAEKISDVIKENWLTKLTRN